MTAPQSIPHPGLELCDISVRVTTDPAGRCETPAQQSARVSIHLGRTVYMACERAGLKHSGWGVHGDIEVVPANTSAIWEPDGPDTALIISVHPRLLAATANELGLPVGRIDILNRFQVRDAQIEHIGWALKAEMESGYPNGRVFLDSLSTALATSLLLRHSSAARPEMFGRMSMSGRRLRLALAFIEDNVGRDLSLAEIAGAAGLSISHLKATFREMTGTPVHRYVIARRVERAAGLLAAGALTVREAAVQTGFAHQSHLARHMRRLMGCSPKEIRASRQK